MSNSIRPALAYTVGFTDLVMGLLKCGFLAISSDTYFCCFLGNLKM